MARPALFVAWHFGCAPDTVTSAVPPQFVKKIVEDSVGPILEKLSGDLGKKAVNVLGVHRRLVKIYIKEFTLGGKPPKIAGVKAW